MFELMEGRRSDNLESQRTLTLIQFVLEFSIKSVDKPRVDSELAS